MVRRRRRERACRRASRCEKVVSRFVRGFLSVIVGCWITAGQNRLTGRSECPERESTRWKVRRIFLRGKADGTAVRNTCDPDDS